MRQNPLLSTPENNAWCLVYAVSTRRKYCMLLSISNIDFSKIQCCLVYAASTPRKYCVTLSISNIEPRKYYVLLSIYTQYRPPGNTAYCFESFIFIEQCPLFSYFNPYEEWSRTVRTDQSKMKSQVEGTWVWAGWTLYKSSHARYVMLKSFVV